MSHSAGKPLPEIDAISQPFWAAAKAGYLSMQRCTACQEFTWPPRASCSECGGEGLQWQRLSGCGEVYSFTVVRQAVGGPSARAFEPDIPFTIAWVDLKEGPRIVTNIVGCPVTDVAIGMCVEVEFVPASSDIWLPKFRPSSAL